MTPTRSAASIAARNCEAGCWQIHLLTLRYSLVVDLDLRTRATDSEFKKPWEARSELLASRTGVEPVSPP